MLIFQRKFFRILIAITVLMAFFSIEAQAQPVLTDINGTWAQKTIQTLIDKGVIAGYPDGTFKPDQPITRAEFSKLVAKTFNYQASSQGYFSDTTGSWAKDFISSVVNQKVMNPFADGNFKPEQQVNRAQMATMLARIIHLGKPEEKYDQWQASFTDLPSDHWAFRYVEIGQRLELFPAGYKTTFQPDKAVTRSEAAWMVHAVSDLQISKGKITSISQDTGLVNIKNASDGEPVLAMITPETVLLRNNATSDIDTLLNGDEATVIAASSGDVKFLKAFGQITKNDLLSRISSMTKGALTKDQISAMVAGDWDTVKDNLKGDLFNKMIDMGLTPAEAEGIMVQDWNYLDSLSRERLSQALSNRLGITPDFAQALLARDMQKIQEYGKIELATAALSKLLGVSDNQQNDTSY